MNALICLFLYFQGVACDATTVITAQSRNVILEVVTSPQTLSVRRQTIDATSEKSRK